MRGRMSGGMNGRLCWQTNGQILKRGSFVAPSSGWDEQRGASNAEHVQDYQLRSEPEAGLNPVLTLTSSRAPSGKLCNNHNDDDDK